MSPSHRRPEGEFVIRRERPILSAFGCRESVGRRVGTANYERVSLPVPANPQNAATLTGADSSAQKPSAGELFAFEAICWPFATLSLAAVLFRLGMPIGPFHLWAGLLVALIAGRVVAGSSRDWLVATLGLAVATVAGGAALGWLYDFSGDGQWYHLPAALGLAQGWNPLQTPRLDAWNAGFEREIASAAVYVQHYSKGAWIVVAAAYRATGLLEAAKVFNLLYLLAAYALTAGFLGRLGLSRGWARALALAAAANPVTLYQLPSFFVDGQVAALCTLLVVLSLDYLRAPRPHALFLLGACVVLLANVKFTGLVYALALGGGFVAVYGFTGARRAMARYAAVGSLAAIFAVVVVGYQPYVTNFQSHGNPFYPVLDRDQAAETATAGQFDIWAPPAFMAMGRLEKLTRSLFAESGGAEAMPRWKVPFTVAKRELYIFFNTEPRYGGFGPLFGSVLLATLVVFVLAGRAMDRRVRMGAVVIALVVALVALLNPEAWWARLSPQLWLVPVILLSAVALGAPAWPRRAGAVLVLFLLGNSALVAALNWGRAVEKNHAFREQMTELQVRAAAGPLEVAMHPSFRMITEYRLGSMSIPYQRVLKPSCAAPFLFSYPASAQAAACPAPKP